MKHLLAVRRFQQLSLFPLSLPLQLSELSIQMLGKLLTFVTEGDAVCFSSAQEDKDLIVISHLDELQVIIQLRIKVRT